MLGPYWVPTREKLVSDIEFYSIESALSRGYSVVIDATNFKEDWKNKFEFIGHKFKTIYQDFTNISVEECIERDSKRIECEKVGAEVITNMYNKYIKK